MARISEHDRITLLMMRGWGELKRSYVAVKNLLNENFRVGQPSISSSTVKRTVQRFEETDCVRDKRRSGRPKTATNPDQSLDVLLSFVEDPHLSTRKAAQVHGIDAKSVCNILKSLNFHPYKIQLVHELNEDDPDRRLQFWENVMTRIDSDPNLPYNILYSDEATFHLKGNCNRHNCNYWSDSNPYWMRESKTQYLKKVNAGLISEITN